MFIENVSTEDTTPQLSKPGQEEKLDTFESLFSELASMKETAANLPPDERKVYAEKVAQSFYAALGGSSDEDEEEDE